jgi:uncharacterized membrane protein YdfJ with MMPL/SSD domain
MAYRFIKIALKKVGIARRSMNSGIPLDPAAQLVGGATTAWADARCCLRLCYVMKKRKPARVEEKQ